MTAPPRIDVDLGPHRERVARSATQRHEYAIRNRLHAKDGYRGDPYTAHLLGSAGECAVSLWTGLPWRGEFFEGKPQPIDIGSDIEVKTSPVYYDAEKDKFMDLILRTNDRVEPRYVRCTLDHDWTVWLDGWIWGEDAQIKRYWERNRDRSRDGYAWYFPIPELHPMYTFRKELSDDSRSTPRRPNGRVQSGYGARGRLVTFPRAV